MRQEQEQFRSFDRGGAPDGAPLGVDTKSPRGWNRIDTSGVSSSTESRKAFRLREVRFGIHQEDNEREREKEIPQEQKSDGLEPFLNQEFQEENLFVNNYGGNYSQNMELNRGRVERALKIAHLEGKVFLTNLQPSRSRAEAQGNELAAKRFFIFEKKTQKVEEENPLKRVVSVPEGWRIEINDQRMTEELTEKKLSGEKLLRAFTNRFNSQLKNALRECVWREKCSNEKDEHFKSKLFWSLFTAGFPAAATNVYVLIVGPPSLYISISGEICVPFIVFGLVNLSTAHLKGAIKDFQEIIKERDPGFRPPISSARNTDHFLEYFMPDVEVDKVARTFAYLAGKGRTLVREAKE